MNPLTNEWIEKAEGDILTAQREYRARIRPNYDVELVSLCLEIDPTFSILEPDLRGLDIYAVRTRYPGQNADRDEAKTALKTSKAIRFFVRKKLSLE